MLFSRKKPATWGEWFRVLVWPRRSWSRSAKYVSKRIMRLTASPHAVAAGVAAGVFASFTPFIGFHFFIAFLVAYIVAGNFLAAALGTFFGNPATFPLIWASTYKVGTFIVVGSATPEDNLNDLSENSIWADGFTGLWDNLIGIWEPVIKPMLVGAFPLGAIFGIAAYIVTRAAIATFRQARSRDHVMTKSKDENLDE